MRRRTSRSAGTSSRRRLANAARSSSGWCAIELTESRFAIHSSRVSSDVALDLGLAQLLERAVLDRPPPLAREHARQAGHAAALERLVDHGLGLVAEVRELDRDVPEDHERPARPQHAGDLGDRLVGGEPVERLGREDGVDARRRRAGSPRRGRRAPRRPGTTSSSTARIASSGSTATTRANRGTSARVSLPVPAPRSSTSASGAEAELGDHAVEQLLRPPRPPELVLARGAPERVRRGFS